MPPAANAIFLNETLERKLGFARAVKAGSFLFISGTVSIDETGTIVGQGNMALQIETIYNNLRSILSHAGAEAGAIVKETIFTTDMAAFIEASQTRHNFYSDRMLPASTAVTVASLAHPDVLIEIEAVALL